MSGLSVAGCTHSTCRTFDCNNSGADGGDNTSFGDTDGGALNQGGDGGKSTCAPDPGNYDIPNNGCDDDGDGKVDNAPSCDANLPVSGDASAFAQAVELCNKASGPADSKWGVISASYTRGYGSSAAPMAEQHGILSKYGSALKPRANASLGALSSGYAREYDTCKTQSGSFKGGCPMSGAGTAPPGFPKPAQGCPISNAINDVSTVHLEIKVPNNAKGLQFDFNFLSGEWPEWVCTPFNDAFVVMLKSTAFNNGAADNISFDAKMNPVSVNNGFFDRCSPANAPVGCAGSSPTTHACSGGDAELQGTGFYAPGAHCSSSDSGGGATGWLTTTAPVRPGEVISIDFMIWDTGDQIYDSSVLLDHFTWLPGDTTTGTARPPN